MGFKVVHTYALPDVDHGEDLIKSLGATLIKGIWPNETEKMGQGGVRNVLQWLRQQQIVNWRAQ